MHACDLNELKTEEHEAVDRGQLEKIVEEIDEMIKETESDLHSLKMSLANVPKKLLKKEILKDLSNMLRSQKAEGRHG